MLFSSFSVTILVYDGLTCYLLIIVSANPYYQDQLVVVE